MNQTHHTVWLTYMGTVPKPADSPHLPVLSASRSVPMRRIMSVYAAAGKWSPHRSPHRVLPLAGEDAARGLALTVYPGLN